MEPDWLKKQNLMCSWDAISVSKEKIDLDFVTKALHIEVELLTSIEKEDEDEKTATYM